MVTPATLEDAIATYNEYRRPMAVAELVDHAEDGFVVRFEGPFCRMCCDYDYFEDLIYELAALGEDPSAIEVCEITDEGAERFLVGFRIAR